MRRLSLSIITIVVFCTIVLQSSAFNFSWKIDETPEGTESATVAVPVQVVLLGEVIEVPSHSASLELLQRYSVYLGPEWSVGHACRLLQTFESIPQRTNSFYEENPELAASVWRLTSCHVLNDISVECRSEARVVTIAEEAFVHATPRLAEINGVRGRYFSKT